MSHQPSLFESVLVPSGKTAQATPDLVHLAQGWRVALGDLRGPGRRWLVSPWFTTKDMALRECVQKGDRLLLRGSAEDFLHGKSRLDAIQALQEWGVDVRRVPHLHAKVYAREHEGAGVVWLGSANLSQRGEDGGQHSGQVEAMSGPHPLTPRTLTELEYLWANSRPFSVSDIQYELDRLVQAREEFREQFLQHADLGILALRLSFRLLGGQFTIPPHWLGHGSQQAQKDGVRYPSVEFIDPDNSLASRFRAFIRAEKRKLGDVLEDVPGMSGVYLLRTQDQPGVTVFLSQLEAQARQRFEKELEAERAHLRQDFIERFERAFERFLSERSRPRAVTPQVAAQQAAQALDEYLSRDAFRISAQFFLPLRDADDPYSGLAQAMSQVQARQRLLP